MAFYNLLFKKAIVNRTKLQHLRQKTINYNNNFKKLKSVCKKSIETYDIHKSQKFVIFHNNETIKSTINKIIKTVKTI